MAQLEPVFLGSDVSRLDWATLEATGLRLPFINVRDLLTGMRVNFAAGEVYVQFRRDAEVKPGSSVWYSPGSLDLFPAQLASDNTDLRFIQRQFEAALLFLEDWLSNTCAVIDRPDVQRRWSNKALQLARLAISLSDCLVDTELLSDSQFLSAGHVLKHLSESRAISQTESFFAQILTDQSIHLLRAGESVPLLMQPLVTGDAEYRTFYFGGESSTVALPCSIVDGVVDIQFRPEHIEEASLVPCPMPDGVLRRISLAFGLNFFAVDYVMLESRVQILEINPQFSWAWLPPDCITGVVEAFSRYYIAVSKGG
jgi:hypothetical protein